MLGICIKLLLAYLLTYLLQYVENITHDARVVFAV